MAIKKLKVSNFKSFKELDLELGQFNVLIGANASGKSNFTEIFKFLRDIPENSLEDAVLRRGGLQSLLNLKIGDQSDFTMQVEVQYLKDRWWPVLVPSKKLKVVGIDYSFTLGIRINEFFIKSDKLKHILKSISLSENGKVKRGVDETLEDAEIIFYHSDGKQGFDINPINKIDLLGLGKVKDILSLLFSELHYEEIQGISSKTLLINIPHIFIRPWDKPFGNIAIYDFDPHLAKEAVQFASKAELEENGKNLALVLNNIIEDDDKKRTLCNLMEDLLPFVEDVDTEKYADSILIRLRENFYRDKYLRSYLLSDGTINIAALIAALYFEEKDLIIIEEPERNIHPHLISRLLNMMKEASNERQIIVTTYSPEVVKHAGIENILFVSRDKDGFSIISRPSEKEEVKTFLQNELGLDDLFVQNLLGV